MDQERESVGVRRNVSVVHLAEQAESNAGRRRADERVEGEWGEGGGWEVGEEEQREW